MRASLRSIAVAALVGLALAAWAAPGQAVRSVYTSLDTARCRLLSRHEETGATLHRCRGVAGYALQADDDARMSVNVVTPAGRVHELNYWSTGNFSSLGPRAEWRVRGERPIALIVRVNANEDPSNPERTTSYLAVAKVSARGSCVTDRIAPSAKANELARRAADRLAGRPCPGAPAVRLMRVALLLATLGAAPLAAQSRPAHGDTASLVGRTRTFFDQIRKESRPGAAAYFPRRGDWSWVRSEPRRGGGMRAGVWRFRADEVLPAMSAGGPLCGTFAGRYGHSGPVETVFGMQVKMHREPWRRVRGTRFVPRGEPDDSPTFVEWRREDGRWVVSAFGDRRHYTYVPRVLGEPRGMIVRDLVVTPSPPRYAAETEWFRNNQPITLRWDRYIKYGRPRPIDPAELSRIGLLGQVVIYAERGKSARPDVLYVPVNASHYQPYEGHVSLPCS